MASACSIRVRGVVQGVGFRPFIYRLARANTLNGWVLNEDEGVEIHLEGTQNGLEAFVRDLKSQPPPAASIAAIDIQTVEAVGLREFTILSSQRREHPTVRISPDLPVCGDCLKELFDPDDPRYLYPYINCTNCGPRYTVILGLPYDRPNTTMKDWMLGPGLRLGIFRSGRPALSCAAGSLSHVRPDLLSGATCEGKRIRHPGRRQTFHRW